MVEINRIFGTIGTVTKASSSPENLPKATEENVTDKVRERTKRILEQEASRGNKGMVRIEYTITPDEGTFIAKVDANLTWGSDTVAKEISEKLKDLKFKPPGSEISGKITFVVGW